ncbi:hypothetical protein M0M92_11665 [Klebsiella quasipneumoniae]|nr:hypothetical protein M0M92_11665 [Klebsiella quasipneumoniae]
MEKGVQMFSSFATSIRSSQTPRLRNMFSVLMKILVIVMPIVKILIFLRGRVFTVYGIRIFLIANKINKSIFETLSGKDFKKHINQCVDFGLCPDVAGDLAQAA